MRLSGRELTEVKAEEGEWEKQKDILNSEKWYGKYYLKHGKVEVEKDKAVQKPKYRFDVEKLAE